MKVKVKGKSDMKLNKKGFTLVEIMIVVAIIGLLAAIAIPAYIKTRQDTFAKDCCNNLRQIRDAQQRYMFEHANKAPAYPSDLVGTDSYILKEPKCKAGGAYTLVTTGEMTPTCSSDSTDYPHKI
jgi:prepilin-type N-terminal cleavage/methylation domain-containing protein